MNKHDTALLQHWMKEVITSPGNLQHKLHKANTIYSLNEQDVVAMRGNTSVYARLNVYTSGYILRLLECLSADFPVLQKFVGDEVFNAFAKASLVWSTPTSYTLYDLGKNFIAFLESTRPTSTEAGTNAMLDLPIELAKLERSKQEVIRAAGTEEYELLQSISIEDILTQPHNIMLSLPDSSRLLNLKFPLKSFFEKVSKDDEYELPSPERSFIAVSRKNYRITISEFAEWQYLFLLSCTQPRTLIEAVEATVYTSGIAASTLMADLYVWLPAFCDSGLLTYTKSEQRY